MYDIIPNTFSSLSSIAKRYAFINCVWGAKLHDDFSHLVSHHKKEREKKACIISFRIRHLDPHTTFAITLNGSLECIYARNSVTAQG